MATKRRVNAKKAILRPIMGVAEFAETLGISIPCARNWIYQRRVASVKLGKLLCVPTSEVERLVTENLRPANEPGLLIPKSKSERISLGRMEPRKVEDVLPAEEHPRKAKQDSINAHTPCAVNSFNRFKGTRGRP